MDWLVGIIVLVVLWLAFVAVLGRFRRAQERRGTRLTRRSLSEEPEVPPGRITGTTGGMGSN